MVLILVLDAQKNGKRDKNMTERKLINQTKKLVDDYYSKRIKQHIERLVKSGALDCESEDENSLALAKVVLKVALEDVSNEISLYSDEYKKEYKNLKNF